MNNLLNKFFKLVDYFTGILTGLMVIVVFLNVILRVIFNSGLTWSEEMARYLFVYVTYIGAISAMYSNGHLSVDTLISRLNKKAQLVLYIISQLIIAFLMIILIKGSISMVTLNINSYTAALGIPYSVLYFSGVLTGVCIAILSLKNIINAIKNRENISKIVTLQTLDEDIDLDEDIENLSDEEYQKLLESKEEE